MGSQRKKEQKLSSSADKDPNLLSSLDNFFASQEKVWFWISFVLLLTFSFLFFDPKVSIGGDDSEYINRGFNFIKEGKFPGFQGPLYPMLLGLMMGIAGLNLVVMKFFSTVFMLVHFWLFYKVFRKYLPPSILVPVLLMLSINSSMLYFASSTYTESFFLMVQSFFLFMTEKYFIRNFKPTFSLKADFKGFLLLGLAVFLMAITKNIGLTALIGVALFFLVRKKWLAVAYVVFAFAIFQVPFSALKKYGFEATASQVSGQGSSLLLKQHNNPALGKEDFSGYVNRIVVNSKEYLSKHFPIVYGLKSDKPEERPVSSAFWTLVLYGILLTGFVFLFNKSEFWTFLGTYLIVSCGLTFLVLQVYWSQERLILIYTPLLLVYLFFTIYYLIKNYRPGLSWILVAVMAIFFIANATRTLKKIPVKINELSHYLKGDLLYGFTPDWIHFFEMSKWAAENLPESSYVASRKPGMSFIYSGGESFYGIWNVPSEDPEELYNKLKESGVTHVLMGSLRVDPSRNTGRTISTVGRYLSIIHSAYPDKIEFVHKIGEQEPAYLYKIH